MSQFGPHTSIREWVITCLDTLPDGRGVVELTNWHTKVKLRGVVDATEPQEVAQDAPSGDGSRPVASEDGQKQEG